MIVCNIPGPLRFITAQNQGEMIGELHTLCRRTDVRKTFIRLGSGWSDVSVWEGQLIVSENATTVHVICDGTPIALTPPKRI